MIITKDLLTGRIVPAHYITFLDSVFDSKRHRGIWPTIELLVNFWKGTNPTKYDSFIVDTKDKKETRYRKTGAGKSGHFRSLVDIPVQLHGMIRKVYNVDELEMDGKFFREFAKRFREFSVAEKI